MALGFRKSLFGYNCEEVSDYINKANAENKEVLSALDNKLKTAQSDLENLRGECETLKTDNAKLCDDLNFYKSKYEEVKKLSDNIGKLYLVAQTNARAIMSAAKEAKDVASEQIGNSMSVINEVNDSLNQIKLRLSQINADFTQSVGSLNSSLDSAKALIENSELIEQQRSEEFEKIFNNITR